MHVTQHRAVLDPVVLDRLWELYEVSVRPTSEVSVSQELYLRDEFDHMLRDDRNRLWVLHDDERLAAMLLIATDLSTLRYFSRAYFERNYPEQVANGTAHFIVWLVVHPAYVATGAIARLGRPALALEIAEGAVLVFDVPWVHQPEAVGGFAEVMNRVARMAGSHASTRQIEVQRYFAIDFSERVGEVGHDPQRVGAGAGAGARVAARSRNASPSDTTIRSA
jgi:hypothetical protein